MPQLHVKISWLYFFRTHTSILQMSSEDSEWRTNIHGIEEYEVGGDWKGGGLLWEDS
jgi:hypothetical protein